jgi:hypothetical protein
MTVVPATLHLPVDLCRAVRALPPQKKGDPTTVIGRAGEEYVTPAGKRLDARRTVSARSGATPRPGTHGPR